MPYVDRLNRVCGFLDIEEKENSSRFQRRYFILDTQGNVLLWYMDNPQNLPSGASFVGSLRLTYISKVSEATAKQKPKTEFCFVINAVSRRYFLQANDVMDMKDWVAALNRASKITVPKSGSASSRPNASSANSDHQGGLRQHAYKAEIVGGVVVHTPIQNEAEELEGKARPGVLKCGYCVKQGNVRKSWKRRFFTLDHSSVCYYKSETEKEPLRSIPLRDILKVHECLVKSGDLLLRDNLFEIITSSRTFYIQTDSPGEMHDWIRDIEMKIQDFRGPRKGNVFQRAPSVCGSQNSSSDCRGQLGEERRPTLNKSLSVAPGWQPWTPVPPGDAFILDGDDDDCAFSCAPAAPSRSSSSTSSSTSSSSNSLSAPVSAPPVTSSSGLGMLAGSSEVARARRRHRSQPQPHTFSFNLDDDSIRTTDV
ncbi:pleckstrin homology domain-containing family A member 2 [Neosynchiropus ocellatus]